MWKHWLVQYFMVEIMFLSWDISTRDKNSTLNY